VSIRKRAITLFAVLGIALSSVIALSSPAAHAAGNGQFSIAPTGAGGQIPRDWFEYTMRPGQVLRDMVTVSNLTPNPLHFAIYPADAYDTPLDGSFALLKKDEPSRDAGTWARFGENDITIPGKQRADIPFEISVPLNASPGDHALGLVAQDLDYKQEQLAQGKGVQVQQRVGSRVYIRVLGALQPSLQVTKLAIKHNDPLLPPFTGGGKGVVAYQITNTGNVRLSGTALLKVKGLFGRTIKTFKPRNIPELLPKSSVVFTEQWKGLPIIDRLTADVTVTTPGSVHHFTKNSWKIPWLEVLIVLLIILFFFGRRRYKRWKDNRPEPPPPTPEMAERQPVHA
jgi:hypothetical protein